MKISFLNLCLFIGTMFSTIQSQNISGKVSDTNLIPIGGVNVSVENSNNGAVTDFDGNFSLSNVDSNSKLVFSYIGYQTVTVEVGMQKQFSVILNEDLSELDEVVVIGYGSQKLSRSEEHTSELQSH